MVERQNREIRVYFQMKQLYLGRQAQSRQRKIKNKNPNQEMVGYLIDTQKLAHGGKYEEALGCHIWFHDLSLLLSRPVFPCETSAKNPAYLIAETIEKERSMHGVRL